MRTNPPTPAHLAELVPLPGGRRLTPQRQLIYSTLAATDSHPDAERLIALVRGRDPRVSVATVYNTLRLLADAGAVLELRGLGPKTRYDANIDEHDHFTCRLCGSVEDVPRQWPVPVRLHGTGLAGYRVEDVSTHLRGICADCRADSRAARRQAVSPAPSSVSSPASRRSR